VRGGAGEQSESAAIGHEKESGGAQERRRVQQGVNSNSKKVRGNKIIATTR